MTENRDPRFDELPPARGSAPSCPDELRPECNPADRAVAMVLRGLVAIGLLPIVVVLVVVTGVAALVCWLVAVVERVVRRLTGSITL